MVEIGPAGGFTEEEVEDIVGAMAEAGYGLEYDDAKGLIARTRQGPNPYDAAQTFDESGLTLTQIDTIAANGSVTMGTCGGDELALTGTTVQARGGEQGVVWGVYFDAKSTTDSITVHSAEGNAIGECDVKLRVKGGETLDTITGQTIDGGGTYTLQGPVVAGETYDVVVDVQNSDSVDVIATGTGENDELDVNGGYYASYDDTGHVWDDLRPAASPDSGSAYLEWANPTDLYGWDVATYTVTEDGETVDVYVAYNDGSGWTRTNGGNPISRNYSLGEDSNISPSDAVRIEAELSREDSSNNPTLDSAYRSWVV